MSATHFSEPSPGSPPGPLPPHEPLGTVERLAAQSLLRQMDQLIARSERWVWVHAISTWLGLTLIAAGMLALCDVLFRWQDPGMRWLCWLVWLLWGIFAGFWWLRRAWRFTALPKPKKRERISLQIERLFSQTQFEIASATSFAELLESPAAGIQGQDVGAVGSVRLQGESIRRCQQLLTELPLSQAIDNRKPLRQLMVLILLVGLFVSIVVTAPTSATIAVQRLFLPWKSLQWPRVHQLQFVDLPKVIAAGEDLLLKVVDQNDHLPATVQLEVQWPGTTQTAENTSVETLVMKIAEGAAQLALPGSSLRASGSQNVLKLRAKGGDDQAMPWQEILIADVPQLKSFAIRVVPPPYSGQVSTEVAGHSVRVLAGSRITIRGEWTSKVQSASIERWNLLQTHSASADIKDEARSHQPAVRSEDMALLQLQDQDSRFLLTANQSSSMAIDGFKASDGIPIFHTTEIAIGWKSLDGIKVVGPKWNIQIIPDRLPTIEWLQPIDEQPVTPSAEIPLEALVADDLGLKQITLHWKSIGSKETGLVNTSEHEQLWEEEASIRSTESANVTLSRKIAQTWSIPAMASAVGITGLELWLEVADSAGQVVRSQSIHLRFTTPEQALTELAQRQADIRNKIEQALQQQREAALPVRSSIELLEKNGTLQQEDRDALQSAARNQKNLRKALTQEHNSVKESLEAIADQLNANHLAESDLAEENRGLRDRLSELEREDLAIAQQSVARAAQLANDAPREDFASDSQASLVEQLTESSSAQDQIMNDLQQMLDSLARTESLRQSQSELLDVARKQREVHERTEQLQRSMLLAPKSLGLDAEKTRIEVAQSELARETERVQQQLRDDSEALKERSPQLAENSAKLADELEKDELALKMREAKDAIQVSKLDMALQQQQAAMDSLSRILDQTSQASQPTLDQLEQALSGAQERLSSIADQQQLLSDAIVNRNNPNEEKLTEQVASQAELRSNTEQLLQQLEGWLGENSLEDLLQAIEDQQSAESSLQAEEQQAAGKAAQDAADRLQRTSEMLENMKLEVQQENIADQLQRLRPLVDRLYLEEANLSSEAEGSWAQLEPSLKEALGSGENIPQDQQQVLEKTSREYAARQLAIRQLLARAGNEFNTLPAFGLAGEAILADMDQAVAGFERRQYDDTALPAVEAAQRRLKQLQDAIAEIKPQDNNPDQNAKLENEQAEDASQQSPSRAPLASLKLLRSLQQDLLRETQELAEISQSQELSATQQRRLSRVADLQQKLAEQVEALAKEISP